MASIEERTTKDGKKRFRVLVRMKGFPPESATFPRLTDARKWASKIESDMREGRYFKYAEAKRHTIAEMIERYKAEVLPRKSETFQSERTYQLDFWKDDIGACTLAAATPAVISAARDRLATMPVRGGGQRSAASVNRHLAALSVVYSIATREWMWLDDSPMRKVSKLVEPRGRARFLSDDERDALLDACIDSDEPLIYPLVVTAICTGARLGELLGLRWPNIDFERNMIRLEHTKNNDRRAVPLSGPALDVIRDLAAVPRIDTDLVFPFMGGKQGMRTPWGKALKAAQIDNFRFHDLRHTAASYLAMNGATLAEIAEILGHKTLQMVKRYAHLTEQHTSKVVMRMTNKIFGPADAEREN